MFDRNKHKEVINNFLLFLNSRQDRFILKGGTALMMCYDLNRFSEDIDLDSDQEHNFFKVVEDFCKKNSYYFRVAKDTTTTKRVMIHYFSGDEVEKKPLKIELSLRNRDLFKNGVEAEVKNHILVYSINKLCMLKSNAFLGREKIRDLFDLVFIYSNYKDELNSASINQIRDVFQQKDYEYVDAIINDENDELIKKDELIDGYLDLCEDLGIVNDNSNLQTNINNIEFIAQQQIGTSITGKGRK